MPLLLAAAIGACGPGAGETNGGGGDSIRTSEAVPTLAGHWRIAAIDGRAVASGAVMVGDGASIGWGPACAGYAWGYVVSGHRFRTQRRASPPIAAADPRPGVPAPHPCPIGIPPGVVDAANVLDAARRIEPSGTDAVRISGGGHTVTLRSQ
ncbi:hypothetical protein [Croceicoccus hydrothermalis]|uniref:hypothetical protein n=1 Tax=Croceicoccus hydrothermalis TaxID=2867964 RepID=UPI001EFA439E|nr:hypothetical protein [Croceicoccus hydrothermalis]